MTKKQTPKSAPKVEKVAKKATTPKKVAKVAPKKTVKVTAKKAVTPKKVVTPKSVAKKVTVTKTPATKKASTVLIFGQVGQNVKVTIDGTLLSKRISDKETRDAVIGNIKAYNSKNNATLLKTIKASMIKKEVVKVAINEVKEAKKATKEVSNVKEYTLEELEKKDNLNQEEKALYKKLLLAPAAVPKTANHERRRKGEY